MASIEQRRQHAVSLAWHVSDALAALEMNSNGVRIMAVVWIAPQDEGCHVANPPQRFLARVVDQSAHLLVHQQGGRRR
jgi:hypothetical protein